jgi:hypothetical protein
MGRHSGKPAKEIKGQNGKSWEEMTPEEKGREFDASHNRPRSYATKHFGAQDGPDKKLFWKRKKS